jgi:hypothetical protein
MYQIMRKSILAAILLTSFLPFQALAQSKLSYSKYPLCSEVTKTLLIGYFRNEKICLTQIDSSSYQTRLYTSEYSVSLLSNESENFKAVIVSEYGTDKFTQMFLTSDRKMNAKTDWKLVKKYQKQINTILEAYRKF